MHPGGSRVLEMQFGEAQHQAEIEWQQLVARISERQSELAFLDQECQAQRQQLERLRGEVARMTSWLAELAKARAAEVVVEITLTSKKQEIEALTRQVDHLQAVAEEVRRQRVLAEQELQTVENKLEPYRRVMLEYDEINRRVEEARATLERLQHLIGENERQRLSLERELDGLRDSKAELEEEIKRLTEQCDDLEDKCDRLKVEIKNAAEQQLGTVFGKIA